MYKCSENRKRGEFFFELCLVCVCVCGVWWLSVGADIALRRHVYASEMSTQYIHM